MTPEPTEPPADPPPAGPEHPLTRTWGVAMLCVAVALVVGRFTLLPLTLDPEWLSTVFAGLGGAAFVLGVTTVKKGRGEIAWPMGLLGGAAASLLVLAGLWTLRPAPLSEALLAPVDVDAFTVDVPLWGTPDVKAFGGQGRLEVRGGPVGPVLELNWTAAETATLDELLGALSSALSELGEVQRVEAEPAQGPRGPAPLGAVYVPTRDTSTAVAILGCPSGTHITLSLAARAVPEQTLALARRVIGTVRCGEGAPPAILFARWTPAEGFAQEPDSGDSLTYSRDLEGGGWEGMALMPLAPDGELASKLQRMPRLAEAMMASLFPGARTLQAPATATAYGERRHFYAFEVDDAETGELVKMLITAWPCPAQSGTALAMYMGAGGVDFRRGVELLRQPRCPADP